MRKFLPPCGNCRQMMYCYDKGIKVIIVRKVICKVHPYHVFHSFSSERGIVSPMMTTSSLERSAGLFRWDIHPES